MFVEMARQAEQAIVEADAVVFVVDGRAGLTPGDRAIAERLRRLQARPCRGEQERGHAAGHRGGRIPRARPGRAGGDLRGPRRGGARARWTWCSPRFPEEESADEKAEANHPRVAVVGRPNVGKSTLVNALVGEERVIAFDQPGTTRDPIEVPFQRGGRRYTLIDTAGLRRRGKTGEPVEYFSIVKALQAIEESNVAILLLDALDRHHRAGRARRRLRPRARPRGGAGGEQVGRGRQGGARAHEGGARVEARLPRLRRDALHLGAGRARASAR